MHNEAERMWVRKSWIVSGSLAILLLVVLAGMIRLPDRQQQPAPTCPAPDQPNRFGVNEVLGWPGLYTTDRLEAALSLMEQAGIGWVRVTWAWKDMQPQAGDSF